MILVAADHHLPARVRALHHGQALGMKVTEFFVGFGPRLWSVQKGETEYGLKALPLGGYCKIIGMTNLEEVAARRRAARVPVEALRPEGARRVGRFADALRARARPDVRRARVRRQLPRLEHDHRRSSFVELGRRPPRPGSRRATSSSRSTANRSRTGTTSSARCSITAATTVPFTSTRDGETVDIPVTLATIRTRRQDDPKRRRTSAARVRAGRRTCRR